MTDATDRPAATRRDGNDWVRPGGISAAEAFRPAMPLRFQGTGRRPVRRAALSLVVLAIIAVIAYLLAAGSNAPGQAAGSHYRPVVGSHTRSATPLAIATATAVGPAYVYNVSVFGTG